MAKIIQLLSLKLCLTYVSHTKNKAFPLASYSVLIMESTTSHSLSSTQKLLSTLMMNSTATNSSTTTEASIAESLTKAIESSAESLGNFLKAEADSLVENQKSPVVDEDWQKTSIILLTYDAFWVHFILFSVVELNRIFKGGPLYHQGSYLNTHHTPNISQFQLEHWMIVGILTPCVVALYLILIIIAYHTFCKSDASANLENGNVNGQIEVNSV